MYSRPPINASCSHTPATVNEQAANHMLHSHGSKIALNCRLQTALTVVGKWVKWDNKVILVIRGQYYELPFRPCPTRPILPATTQLATLLDRAKNYCLKPPPKKGMTKAMLSSLLREPQTSETSGNKHTLLKLCAAFNLQCGRECRRYESRM